MHAERSKRYRISMPWQSGCVAGSPLALAGLLALTLPACDKGRFPKTSRTDGHVSDLLEHRYLTDQSMPNGLHLIPPPPGPGSPAMIHDERARQKALTEHGTARYALAVADADRGQDATNKAFQCALGTTIDASTTPALYSLLAKLRLDVRAATYPAKNHYKRARPYVAKGSSACAPTEALVRDDGSYPSARGAVGWAYALVLSEVEPQRQSIIMGRGREFGQSRVICDAEWQSDVDAGRQLGAAVVDALQKVPNFRSDLAAARQEVAKSVASGKRPPAGCATESRALASR